MSSVTYGDGSAQTVPPGSARDAPTAAWRAAGTWQTAGTAEDGRGVLLWDASGRALGSG